MEDQQEMRELLADVLCAAGYDAVILPNAMQALKVIGAVGEASSSRHHLLVDIVVTDLRMPLVDGMDVLRTIRLRCPWVRSMLVSAFATEEVRLEAESLGANAVLSKPFGLDELLGTIASLLNRSQ